MQPGLTLRQLNCFVAVAEELNFRRAAERLFITQPPLSRQIQALEQALGVTLFERDRQGVQLTDAGRAFLADARAVLGESARVMARFQPAPAAAPAALTLGITTVVDVGLFAGVEAAFAAACPGVPLVIRPQISARSIRDLARGTMDVAVIGLPSRTDGLVIEHLWDDPLVACLSSRHPAARKRRVSIVDLQHDPLFWFDRRLNPAYDDYCQQVFRRVGFSPRRIPEPAEHHVLLGLIAGGQGIALVPRSLNSLKRQGVSFRPLVESDQLCIRVGVAWRAERASPQTRALVDVLKHTPGPAVERLRGLR